MNRCSGTDADALLAATPGRPPPANGIGIVRYWAVEALPMLVVSLVVLVVFGTSWARWTRDRTP